MDDSLMIEVAGLRMFGRPGLGPYGVMEDGLDGWDDGVDFRSGNEARPQGNGSYALPAFQESRTVSIRGLIQATNAHDHQAHKDRLVGLLADGRYGRITVSVQGAVRWAECRLAAKTKIVRRRGTYLSDFQLQLWCPDPRKFGKVHIEELTGGQSRSLYHYGNTEAAPLVEIRGPITGGYQINSNDGRVFRVNSGIASGARHTIDMNDGLLRVNGRVQAGLVGQADVWKIPPGLLPSGGTLNMALKPDVASQTPVGSVYITDTYI